MTKAKTRDEIDTFSRKIQKQVDVEVYLSTDNFHCCLAGECLHTVQIRLLDTGNVLLVYNPTNKTYDRKERELSYLEFVEEFQSFFENQGGQR